VFYAVMLRPLPFLDSERFVHLWSKDPSVSVKQFVSYPDFLDWRRQSQTFDRMAAWTVIDGMTLISNGEAERVEGVVIFGDFFQMLGVPPVLGTTFQPDGVVLSYRLWQRYFKSDPDVLTQSITLNGVSYRIIGVMPESFQFPVQTRPIDLWASLENMLPKDSPYLSRNFRGFEAMGHLRVDKTVQQAQVEMDVIASALARQYPENKGVGIQLVPELENLVGNVSRTLLLLFAAVAAVLLIACVNVANLLLAKAAGRRHEIAVRAALGASRSRICGQLMAESLLLSLAGSVVGCIGALWVLDSLIALLPGSLPRANEIALDLHILAFTFVVSLLAGILFGLAPAWYAARTDLRAALQESSRHVSEASGGRRLRSLLVVSEITLALILLTGAGLLMNSFWRLLRVNPGVDARNVVWFLMNVSYTDPIRLTSFPKQLKEQLQNIPGVRGASVITGRPRSFGTFFDIDGRPPLERELSRVDAFTVQPGYLKLLGIPLVAGRDFAPTDDGETPPVVLINQTLAKRYFANENPIGKRIRVRVQMTGRAFPEKEIVGVVGDVRLGNLGNLEREPQSQINFPAAQDALVLNYFAVLVKTDADLGSTIPAIRSAVLSVDKQQPIYQVSTLQEQVGQSLAQDRFNALLLGIFSSLALILAVVGLYGVLSYTVAQRTAEIGVRVAMGASSRDVLKLVIQQGLKLTVAGILIGLIGSLALTRLIEGMLFGTSATDPLTFGLAIVVLVTAALLACWIPARRAARVDPIITLRCQ
jgi:putative ABC transport system permease protein